MGSDILYYSQHISKNFMRYIFFEGYIKECKWDLQKTFEKRLQCRAPIQWCIIAKNTDIYKYAKNITKSRLGNGWREMKQK